MDLQDKSFSRFTPNKKPLIMDELSMMRGRFGSLRHPQADNRSSPSRSAPIPN